MLGLRSKILVGFGGLLLILIGIVPLVGSVLNRYSAIIDRSFREDFDSVILCQQMKELLEQIDLAVQSYLWYGQPPSEQLRQSFEQRFDKLLDEERVDSTLPGEREMTEQLAGIWQQYRQAYPAVFAPGLDPAAAQRLYTRSVRLKSLEVREQAQKLIDLNMKSAVSVPRQVRQTAARAKWFTQVLSGVGVLLAVAFGLLVERFVVRPVRELTESVHNVETGKLDLTVPVRSRDELGQLAAAFNTMTAQLRQYRQTEHDRLIRTERTTQLTIDSMPDAVVVTDAAGAVVAINHVAKLLLGLSWQRDVEDGHVPWLTEAYRGALAAPAAPERIGYDSTICVAEGGRIRHLLPRSAPILDEMGRAIGATVVLADVTGLRQLDEMKSGLLSVVSHELKTPLTSLRMILHLIADGEIGDLSGQQLDLLMTAKTSSDRLYEIIENLLDMERIESGKTLMEMKPASAASLVRDAITNVADAFRKKGVTLHASVQDDLPPVLVDATRVGHVFANLLNNSLRHTPSGGRVAVTAVSSDGYVEFAVSDSGTGIPSENLHRIFDKFYRVPGQPSGTGSGLGLAVAKDIVDAHGGRIDVRNNNGAGTTFTFTLQRIRGENFAEVSSDRLHNSM